VLNSGIGPRLIRLSRDTTVWIEGAEQSYAPGLIQDGDLAEVWGSTLQDYSMLVKRLTINPLGNLIGVFAKVDAQGSLVIFPRTGREAGTFGSEPITLAVDNRLQLFGGRGNFNEPNRNKADLSAASWIMCNGYRSRDGQVHALQCFFGSELPPPDAPDWLISKITEMR
jgi:hypothetical protein